MLRLQVLDVRCIWPLVFIHRTGRYVVFGFCICEQSIGSRYFWKYIANSGSGMYIGHSISCILIDFNTDFNVSGWMEDQNPTVCLLITDFNPLWSPFIESFEESWDECVKSCSSFRIELAIAFFYQEKKAWTIRDFSRGWYSVQRRQYFVFSSTFRFSARRDHWLGWYLHCGDSSSIMSSTIIAD